MANDMKSVIMKRLASDADGRSRDKMLYARDEDELGAMEYMLSCANEITPEVEELANAYIELSLKLK